MFIKNAQKILIVNNVFLFGTNEKVRLYIKKKI